MPMWAYFISTGGLLALYIFMISLAYKENCRLKKEVRKLKEARVSPTTQWYHDVITNGQWTPGTYTVGNSTRMFHGDFYTAPTEEREVHY